MGRRFDPTSVAARRLQSKWKQVHRFKLKKRLAKARKKLDNAANIPSKDLEPVIDEAISHALSSSDGVIATQAPSRPTKPNPIKNAIEKRRQRLQQMQEAAEQRKKEKSEQEQAHRSKIEEREQMRRKLTTKTRTGQPNLSKHIDVLLEKIQKQN